MFQVLTNQYRQDFFVNIGWFREILSQRQEGVRHAVKN